MNFKKRVNGSWVDIPHYIHKTDTDTLTLPAVIYGDGTNATVGLKGNTTQSGTPTPDNPIMPEGTGERTGNLFDKSTITTGAFAILTGIRESAPYYCSDFIPITATSYYFQNVVGRAMQNAIVVYDANKQGLRYITIQGSSVASGAVTFEEGDAYIRINCFYTTDVDTVMVNLGSTALPYEPYGYKIPISSGGVTTNIYLGSTQTARRVRKQVVTISRIIESETPNMKIAIVALDTSLVSPRTALSTVVPYGNPSTPETFYFVNANNIGMVGAVGDTDEQITAKYEGSILYYGIAETTGIVNEPLRKIGNYADEISGITIPTIAGANSFDVLTTLKPSEATVNYKGWHPVQSVHERESGAWT